METKLSFEKLLAVREDYISEQMEAIHSLNMQISVTQNESKLQNLYKRLNGLKKVLRHHKDIVEFMRVPADETDKIYRENVISEFHTIIKKAVPDNFPIVFHGTGNIGTVRQIIKTSGLLTPEQKDEYQTSFATQIDVTYKNNILVTLQFAQMCEPYMPYGAIFAFLPQNNEISKVITTGENGEVFNGVNGVNFKNNPERLCGIITTPENLDRVKQWCNEYGWDDKKVFLHNDFVKQIDNIVKNNSDLIKNLETDKML